MARKARQALAPAPAAPVRERREVPPPSWHTKDFTPGYPHQQSIRQVAGRGVVWHLPPFQREVVWTPEQQAAFCNSVFLGYPTATVLAWKRRVANETRVVLLDGQQRITALGATVLRADGTPNPPSRAYFDLAGGRFGTDPGRWALTMQDIVELDFVRQLKVEDELAAAEDWEGYDLWYARIFANDVATGRQLTVYVLDEHARPEFVVEAFRAINRPGIQFDEAEVERLVAAAADFR